MSLDMPGYQLYDGGRVLVNDQAAGDLGMRFCRQNSFDTLPLETTPDPVDLQCGTCGEMLLGGMAWLSQQSGYADLLLILVRVERKSGDGRTVGVGEWEHGIVKALNQD